MPFECVQVAQTYWGSVGTTRHKVTRILPCTTNFGSMGVPDCMAMSTSPFFPSLRTPCQCLTNS